MQVTGGQAFVEQLIAEGARTVFGLPGVQLDWAMDALHQSRDRIRLVVPRHEQATTYLADGFTRGGGGSGVAMMVPGPGMLNALAGLATGYACSSPMLFVTGQIPTPLQGRGLGALHEIPQQSQILAGLTKWSGKARTVAEVPALIHEAFAALRSGRPRPVGIEIPPDVLSATGEIEVLDAAVESRLAPDAVDLARAAHLLRGAERPLIYAGWGVQAADAGESLRALAEMVEAPVVLTTSGRGAMDDRHRLVVSTLGARRLRASADVVLAVGTRFIDGGGRQVACPGAKLILLNAEFGDLGGPRSPEVALHADARLGLDALLAELDGLPSRASRTAEVAAVRAWCADRLLDIAPQVSYLNAIRAALPEDGVLVSELTQVGFAAEIAYPVYRPRTFITPGYQGTLGFGFATALGVKVGCPDRPVVSINGDGGFGWTLAELATARRYGIGVAAVVFNDGAFGNVRRSEREVFDGRLAASELLNPDLQMLAAAFGITAYRADSPGKLESILREAITEDEPALIEVPVGEMPSPWHLIREPAPQPIGMNSP